MGQLKVNVAGVWLPVGSGGGGSDEVAIGPDDPIVTVPSTELWYDTDDVAALTDDVRWNTAWGVVAFAAITASSAAITAVTDVGGMAVNWTADPARRYRTSVNAVWQGTVAGDLLLALITDGSGVPKFQQHRSIAAGGYGHIMMSVVESGLSGSIQRKVQHARNAGTGSSTIVAGAAYPAYIMVEDIGPVTGAVPAIPNASGCRLRRVAALAVPTGGASIDIPFDTEDVDTHGFFAPTSTVITIPAGMAGLYEISGQIIAAANTGTVCYTDVKLNGTVIQRIPAAANASPPFPSFLMNLAVGNTITVAINQNSGGSVNFTASIIMRFMGVL